MIPTNRRALLTGSLILIFHTSSLFGADYDWTDGGGDDLWTTGSNWTETTASGDPAPPAAGDLANFNAGSGAASTIDLGGTINLRDLEFQSDAADGFVIGTTGDKIIFDAGGTFADGVKVAGNKTVTIAADIDVAGTGATALALNPTFGTSTLVLSGNISGNAGVETLRKDGNGTVVLSGTLDGTNVVETLNIRAGTFEVDGGASKLNNLGGQIYLGSNGSNAPGNDGTLSFTNAGGETMDRQLVIGGFSGAGAAETSGGAVVNNDADESDFVILSSQTASPNNVDATRTLTLGGSNTGENEFSGQIRNNGGGASGNNFAGVVNLAKEGAGKWILSGNNIYTGTTSVNEGILQVNSAGAMYASDAEWNKISVANGATLSLGFNSLSVAQITTLRTSATFDSGSFLGLDTAGGDWSRSVDFGAGTNADIGLRKTGAGTFTIPAAQTYTGETHVDEGRLNVGFNTPGSTNASLGSGDVVIASGAELRFNVDQTRTVTNSISGGGDLLSNGQLLEIHGDVNITGKVDVTSGSGDIQVGDFTTNGSIASSVIELDNAGSQFISARSDDVTYSGQITGSGQVRQRGNNSGTGQGAYNSEILILNNASNNYSGGTIVEFRSRVMADANGALGSGDVILNGGGSGLIIGPNATNLANKIIGDGTQPDRTVYSQAAVATLSSAIELDNDGVGDFKIRVDSGNVLNFTGSIGAVAAPGDSVNFQKDNGGELNFNAGSTVAANLVQVSAGVMVIDSTSFTANGISVDAGAILSGSGTINAPISISGTHAPGNSPGIQTTGSDLTYNAGATFEWDLVANSTAGRGTNFDGVDLTGAADLITASSVDFNVISTVDGTDGFWTSAQNWLVWDLDTGSILGDALGAFSVSFDGGFDLSSLGIWSVVTGDTVGGNANDAYLSFTPTPVPEIGTIALYVGGLALGFVIWRRRRAQA